MLILQNSIDTIFMIIAVVVLTIPLSNNILLTATINPNEMSGRPHNEWR